MAHLKNRQKLQAAIDFIASYGMALIVILIALVIIFRIGTSNTGISAPSCTAVPGFTCDFFSITTNGLLTVRLTQAIGSPITINGVACSTSLNATGNAPQYGNVHVGSKTKYYLPATYPVGNVIYSDAYYIIKIYCYGPGGIARQPLGNSFTGYIWLNYSIPNYGSETQRIATVTTPYI
ncbi:MAG: hypothetical protein KGH72_03910 [Candidatus Micrarchaeota archaeon]|nr:hypothetical protein [Candidatus Micrarchaeota archaeon]